MEFRDWLALLSAVGSLCVVPAAGWVIRVERQLVELREAIEQHRRSHHHGKVAPSSYSAQG